MAEQGKFNFIKLKKVIIRNFSLHNKDGKSYIINEPINDGVFCLAGANGLGKTTFLNAINYGLTGIVLAPEKDKPKYKLTFIYRNDILRKEGLFSK